MESILAKASATGDINGGRTSLLGMDPSVRRLKLDAAAHDPHQTHTPAAAPAGGKERDHILAQLYSTGTAFGDMFPLPPESAQLPGTVPTPPPVPA